MTAWAPQKPCTNQRASLFLGPLPLPHTPARLGAPSRTFQMPCQKQCRRACARWQHHTKWVFKFLHVPQPIFDFRGQVLDPWFGQCTCTT